MMKKSPVQITELFYPILCYEANADAVPSTFETTLPVEITAGVAYFNDDEHMAKITIRQDAASESLPYIVNLEAFAVFTFDRDAAKELYGDQVVPNLSVNVASILFSSAREALAHATSRGPYGPAFIEGVVIDSEGVELNFEENPEQMLPKLFGVSPPPTNGIVQLKKVRPAKKKSKG